MLSQAERTGQFLVSLPDGGEANLGTGTYSLTFTDYFHLDPQGKWQPYPEETNNMISDARVQGLDTLRLPDVQIPGRVLRFEMRFGAAAVSERMPRGVPTGSARPPTSIQAPRHSWRLLATSSSCLTVRLSSTAGAACLRRTRAQ